MSVEITPMGVFWSVIVDGKIYTGLASSMSEAWEEVRKIEREKEGAGDE